MYSLKPHQTKSLEKLQNGSVLYGGVGSGKSVIALAYYVRHEKPRRLIVITTAKKRESLEWRKDALFGFGIYPADEEGGVLTVDSWNNIEKYSEVHDAFFIFDEQRIVGSGAWVKAFLRITGHNRWILLSGTPGDTWMDYVPLFLAHGFFRNRTEFLTTHVRMTNYAGYPQITGYYGEHILKRLRAQILVHVPYTPTAKRVQKTVTVPYDQEAYLKLLKTRWNARTDKPVETASELFSEARRILYSDPSRLAHVRTILAEQKRAIVFYSFNYELEILRTLADEIEVAEWNGAKHEEIPQTDRWAYLVQYTAGSEGWNCITTNTVIFYSLPSSYRKLEQAMGRIDRMNTPYQFLHYHLILSGAPLDRKNLKVLGEKKSFTLSAVDEILGIKGLDRANLPKI